MSDTDKPAAAAAPEPSSPGQDTWLDRLRAAVGLKAPASIREELANALASEDVAEGFSPEERAMLSKILRLREVRVDDIMVPRADIEAVSIDIHIGELFSSFLSSGHS